MWLPKNVFPDYVKSLSYFTEEIPRSHCEFMNHSMISDVLLNLEQSIVSIVFYTTNDKRNELSIPRLLLGL